MKTDIYLSLGTNLGDRTENISHALRLLDDAFGSHFDAVSSILATKAVGFEGPDFFNCVVRYRSDKEPLEVLDMCKSIERRMGRTDAPEYDAQHRRVYHDRVIDIDILLLGDLRIDSEMLTVPHPQLPQRPFFQELIDEIRI